MDDLPELPFKQILSHLSLEDRIRSRGVSRSWRNKFNSYPIKSLCYSERKRECIFRKRRLVSGVFTQNFIQSPRLDSLLATFGQSMFSNLKHLRLCVIGFNEANRTTFALTLNSLEQLDIINFYHLYGYKLKMEFELNLPMLRSIHLEEIIGIEKITLDAPSLQNIQIVECALSLRLFLVHTEPVERLLTDHPDYIPVMELKNLKVLCTYRCPIVSTFLSDLEQLKEIAIGDPKVILELFEQKQRYRRTDLKVSLCGLLLDGPDDPAIVSRPVFYHPNETVMKLYAEYPSKLANEIPFYRYFYYTDIEYVEPEIQAIILRRLTDLSSVYVNNLVEDVQRFLGLLKNCETIVELKFSCDQPQDLFDRLPDHSAVQKLTIHSTLSDFNFILRLKQLTHLNLNCSIDIVTVQNVLKKLPFLMLFDFRSQDKRLCVGIGSPNRFWVYGNGARTDFSDLEDVIQFLSSIMPLTPSEFREFYKKFQSDSGQ